MHDVRQGNFGVYSDAIENVGFGWVVSSSTIIGPSVEPNAQRRVSEIEQEIEEAPSPRSDLTDIFHVSRRRFNKRSLVLQRPRIFQTETRTVHSLWSPRAHR